MSAVWCIMIRPIDFVNLLHTRRRDAPTPPLHQDGSDAVVTVDLRSSVLKEHCVDSTACADKVESNVNQLCHFENVDVLRVVESPSSGVGVRRGMTGICLKDRRDRAVSSVERSQRAGGSR